MTSIISKNSSPAILQESSQLSRSGKKQRIINIPLLAATVVFVVVTAPSLYFWHGWQVKRSSKALFDHAQELKSEGKPFQAASYLSRYLQLHGEDAAIRIDLAKTIDQASETAQHKSQATALYYRALAVASDEEKLKIRIRLTELLLDLQRHTEAEREASKLLEVDGENATANRLLARALFGQYGSGALEGKGVASYEMVGIAVEKAHTLMSDDIELSSILALLYRDHIKLLPKEKRKLSKVQREQAADQFIDTMVAAHAEESEALLVRYRYRSKYLLSGAEEDLQKALQYDPDSLQVRLTAAVDAAQKAATAETSEEEKQNYLKQAEIHYQYVLDEIEPSNRGAYLGLTEIYIETDQADKAIETLRNCISSSVGEPLDLYRRLGELLLDEQKLGEARKALAAYDQSVENVSLRLSRAGRSSLQRSQDLLNGRLLLAQGKTSQAIPRLTRVVSAGQTKLIGDRAELQAWYLLGRAYASLGQWDQAAGAYEESVLMQPENIQFRLLAATSWKAAGRPRKAAQHYERALAIQPSSEIAFSLSSVYLQQQTKTAVTQRDWNTFQRSLENISSLHEKSPLKDPWRIDLLKANYTAILAAEKNENEQGADKAVELLRPAEQQYGKEAVFLQRLILFYERLQRRSEADRVVSLLEKLAPEDVATSLTRARLAATRKEYGKARDILQKASSSLPTESQAKLQKELVQINLREGKDESVVKSLIRMHLENVSDLAPLRALADFTLSNNKKGASQWIAKLQQVEGASGTSWRYYQAMHLLSQATGPQDSIVLESMKIQASLQRMRPAWPAARLLKGYIEEYRGNSEAAIEAYQIAIQLGEQRVSVYERLIKLLFAKQRFAEAEQYLTLLQSQNLSNPEMQTLEISVAVRQGQLDQAVELAERRVKKAPDDFLAHVWLGQMQLLTGENSKAETSLKKAVEIAPEDVRSWNGLFGYYVRTKNSEAAKQALASLNQKAKLDEVQKMFVMAQGYELLEDSENALKYYRQAEQAAPENVAIQMRLAAFLLRTDIKEAQKVLRRVLELAPNSNEARRTLAAVLAIQGGEEQWAEAQELLERSTDNATVSTLDQRLQAVLLVRRSGRENLNQALQIILKLIQNATTSVSGDRLLLARLYESESKYQADDTERDQYLKLAQDQYLFLVAKPNAPLEHFSYFAKFLLRSNKKEEAKRRIGRFNDDLGSSKELSANALAIAAELVLLAEDLTAAKKRIETLENIEPLSLRLTTLKASLFKKQGLQEKIEPLVEDYVHKTLETLEDDVQRANLFLAAGKLCFSVQQYLSAEGWHRRLNELVPQHYEPLAITLIKQKKTKQALDLCLTASKEDKSTRPVIVLTSVLSSYTPSEEDLQRVEPIIADAIERHSKSDNAKFSIASIRIIQKREAEAIKLLREVVQSNPDHVLALNNLATLLSEKKGGRAEALKFIDRAIELTGIHPALYDTKGAILVYDGDAKNALQYLEMAVASDTVDPRYQFHLALAYQGDGQIEKAKDELNKALAANLEDTLLTETEKRYLTDIKQFIEE